MATEKTKAGWWWGGEVSDTKVSTSRVTGECGRQDK